MKLVDNKEVGERLKSIREEMHIKSARKFAMDAGIDQSHYSKIEKGDLPLTDSILEKLHIKYGIDKNELLGINVPRETTAQQNTAAYESRMSLEKSIENLTQDKLRTVALIERIMTYLETNSVERPKAVEVLTGIDTSRVVPPKPIDLALDKKYYGQNKKDTSLNKSK